MANFPNKCAFGDFSLFLGCRPNCFLGLSLNDKTIIGMGYKVGPRFREYRLLAPSGRVQQLI